MADYDLLAKILVVGDSGVGKSCLLSRFVDDECFDQFTSTIGVDFKIRTIEIDSKRIKLHLWDTAGQERFRTITTSYYRGSQGILLVFDVTERATFLNIDHWVREIEKHTSTNPPNIMLVGNKVDLPSRVVSKEEAINLAERLGISYIETSAKSAEGVNECFHRIAKQVMSKKNLVNNHDPHKVLLNKSSHKTIRSSCMLCG